MAVLLRINNVKHVLLSRVGSSIILQRFSSKSKTPKGAAKEKCSKQMGFDYPAILGCVDFSKAKWKKFDARSLGITDSMISRASWTVLNNLRVNGFETYLVGGCVRDLVLNRIPKDFDVITTAKLTQIRKQFHRAIIVGRHFPVCRVHIKDSVIEVSSFETVTQTSKGKESFLSSLMPKGCNVKDVIRCKNSLHRDFTVNSLFYDPFACKVYDYANGLEDLRSMKLRTVIPAQLSFKEDPGRILRALRIAARLGLSLSKEIEAAIKTFSTSVKGMNEQKLMMELNYMLSYGAAEPSLYLLWKFKLLEFLLPLHAKYLDQQATKQDARASSMFMKLFFHLDKLIACDRPSVCAIWVGLLAFHLALVNNPQDALVVWTLASVLYHGEWEQGVKFAKEHAEMNVNFVPEIRRSTIYKSDEEIAKAVSGLASLVVDSTLALVEEKSLIKFMSRNCKSSCFGLVFVPKKTGKSVAEVFEVLLNNVESYRSEKNNFEINYNLLAMGRPSEIRFVLGKVVLETMRSGIVGETEVFEAERGKIKTEKGTNEICQLQLPDPLNHHLVTKKGERQVSPTSNPGLEKKKIKKQKLVESESIPDQKTSLKNLELSEKREGEKVFQKGERQVSSTSNPGLKKKKIKKQKLVESESIPDQKTSLKKLELSEKREGEKVFQKSERQVSSTSNPGLKKKKIKKQKLVESESIPDQKTSLKKLELSEKREGEETTAGLHKLVKLFKPSKDDQ